LISFNLTTYHIEKFRFYAKYVILALISIFIIGNIINALIKDRVIVNKNSYKLKNGFPLFTSQKEYISLLKKYPHNPGVKLSFHMVQKGESFWNIAQQYQINIQTLIAANPYLTTLLAKANQEIVIPTQNGVLVAIDNFYDASKMARILKNNEIRGEYFPSVFDLFSLDNIKFIFFKDSIPVIYNSYMTELCNIKLNFQSPYPSRRYTSLFGRRIDPFTRRPTFHDGIDISGKMGNPVYPIREGLVSFIGWKDGFGYTIKIIHPDGYASLYAHCSKIVSKKGDFVTKKDVIAKLGSTGRSTGPHVHLEIYHHGALLDPLFFIW
jgi:murein DD-endopeptidase MepM/ murein hydrolase activator NlpD